MGLFTRNDETNQEEDGQIERISTKTSKNLAELECEESIINDKERFGRVRATMMRVLRAEYGNELANRALSRVNKRIQEGYLNQ